MFKIILLITPFYLKNINYFSKILRAFLSNKMESCILEKINSSMATKLCTNLLNNCKIYIFSALHNSITKLCSALFKCEDKLKIGW